MHLISMYGSTRLAVGIKTLALVMVIGVISTACGQEAAQVEAQLPVIEVEMSGFTNFPEVGWAVTALPSTVGKGRVPFNVANINTAITQEDKPYIAHTLWVIKTDLPPGELPLKGDGLGIDVSDVDVWAAVPAMNSGEENTLNLNLVAGSYVLVCNVVPDNPDLISHYERGSYTGFTVSE